MELLVASAIGVLTAAGIYLILRLRTFPVIIGTSLISYAVIFIELVKNEFWWSQTKNYVI